MPRWLSTIYKCKICNNCITKSVFIFHSEICLDCENGISETVIENLLKAENE